MHKQADKLGYAKFGITDFSTKLVYDFNRNTKLIVKIGLYNELSNSTYIGLTQTMYDRGGQDFVLMAPDDRLDIKRYSLSASFNKNISKKLKFNTTIYGYTTSRNWQRQDFSSSKTASKLTGVIWGDSSLPNGDRYNLIAKIHIKPCKFIGQNLFKRTSQSQLIIPTAFRIQLINLT